MVNKNKISNKEKVLRTLTNKVYQLSCKTKNSKNEEYSMVSYMYYSDFFSNFKNEKGYFETLEGIRLFKSSMEKKFTHYEFKIEKISRNLCSFS